MGFSKVGTRYILVYPSYSGYLTISNWVISYCGTRHEITQLLFPPCSDYPSFPVMFHYTWWKELISDLSPLQFLNIYLNTYWFRARVDSPLSSSVSICINAACNFKSFSICVLDAYKIILMQTLLNMFSKQWCCQMSVDSSICMYVQYFELSTINTNLKAISCNMLYFHVCPLSFLHQWCHPSSYYYIVVLFYLWIASRE